jgi:hypothetical protein
VRTLIGAQLLRVTLLLPKLVPLQSWLVLLVLLLSFREKVLLRCIMMLPEVLLPPLACPLLPLLRRGAPPNALARKPPRCLLPVVVVSSSRFLRPSGN